MLEKHNLKSHIESKHNKERGEVDNYILKLQEVNQKSNLADSDQIISYIDS